MFPDEEKWDSKMELLLKGILFVMCFIINSLQAIGTRGKGSAPTELTVPLPVAGTPNITTWKETGIYTSLSTLTLI